MPPAVAEARTGESVAVANRAGLVGSAESPRAEGRRLRARRVLDRLGDALIGLTMAVLAGLILATAIAGLRESSTGRAFHWAMCLLASIIELAAWGLVVYSVGKLVWNRPGPATTPKESALRCLSGALAVRGGGAAYTPRDAFLLLMDQAKAEAGGFEAFDAYWKNVREGMIWIAAGIRGESGPWSHWPGRHAWVTVAVDRWTSVSPTVARVRMKFSAHCDPKRGLVPRTTPVGGPAEFVQTSELIRIGKRWYVASPFWRGLCTSAPRPHQSGFGCPRCGYALEAVAPKAGAMGWVTCPECGRDALQPPGFSGRAPGTPAPALPARPLNLAPPSPLCPAEREIDLPTDSPAPP